MHTWNFQSFKCFDNTVLMKTCFALFYIQEKTSEIYSKYTYTLYLHKYTFLLDVLMIKIHQYSEHQAVLVSKALIIWVKHSNNTWFCVKEKGQGINIYFALYQALCYECNKC